MSKVRGERVLSQEVMAILENGERFSESTVHGERDDDLGSDYNKLQQDGRNGKIGGGTGTNAELGYF